jgi:myo-inositol 2-dehydrogenase / D-chiro-inositol 1-dehydrogenase
MLETAPDGPVLKAGIIGCGGRGTGAAMNFLDAGPNLQLLHLAMYFRTELTTAAKKLKLKKESKFRRKIVLWVSTISKK